MSDDHKPEPPRRRLPRQLPPPLTRPPGGPLLPHAAVLDELLSPVGVLLWQLLQDATLWSTAERTEREGLFADAARATRGAVPEVEEELDALAVLVRDPHPDAGPVVARMCDRVRAWAEDRGLYGTALAFAQAGALADPECARAAYEVGRLARCRAEYARAEVWYQRALGLAKRSGEKEVQALGLSGLANVYSQRGNHTAALALNERAVRFARRHSLFEALGSSYHGTAVEKFETGDVQGGMQDIRRAVRALGVKHERIPFIVHDACVALMDQSGAFATAGELLKALLPHFTRPEDRTLALANLARASGATGQRQQFEVCWTDCWAVINGSAASTTTDALIALGRGAVSLNDWTRARQAAGCALTRARERQEGKSALLAESLLNAAGAEDPPPGSERPHELASVTEESSAAIALGRDLLQALRSRDTSYDGLLETFLSALKSPHDARWAYLHGRSLRAAGEFGRAVAWLEHGIAVARAARDRAEELLCLAALANVHVARGDLRLALELHGRRLDLAGHAGLRDMEGDAMVDLCAVSFALDDSTAGLTFTQKALEILGPDHALIPRLAHDLAVFLMESRGDYGNALLLFRALRTRQFPPKDRMLLEAGLSRAAAGVGNAQLFEQTWSAVWGETASLPDSECPAGVLIHLAHGALTRGHFDLAEQAARRSLEIAADRCQAHEESIARRLVEEISTATGTRARSSQSNASNHDVRAARRVARGIAAAIRSGAAAESCGRAHSLGIRPEL